MNDGRNMDAPVQPGNFYETTTKLHLLSNGGNIDYWRRFLLERQYFTSLFKITGHKWFEDNSKHILSQMWMYGSIAIMYNPKRDKYAKLNVVKQELDMYGDIQSVEVLPLQPGFGYTSDMPTTIIVPNKGENVVIGTWNLEGYPAYFYFDKFIVEQTKLATAAMTGSISEIKKFQRLLANDNGEINEIETQSFTDENTPYVNVVGSPSSYRTKEQQGEQAAAFAGVAGNEMRPIGNGSSSKSFWDEHLNKHANYWYRLLGRKTNTSKKAERNTPGEIEMDEDNYDILLSDPREFIEKFVRDLNEKFNLTLRVEDTCKVVKEKGQEKGDDEDE